MSFRKFSCATAAIIVGSATLIACGSSSNSADSADGGTFKVGFLTPVQRNDGGITALQLEGLDRALNSIPDSAPLTVVDNVSDPEKQVRTLRSLAQTSDLVVAGSAVLNQAVETIAPEFPDTRFISFGAPTKTFHENVTSVVAQPGLSAVLMGGVMAMRTTSGKIGAVGGVEVPQNAAWGKGIAQGAHEIDPSVKTSATVTGDYNDVGKAKQAASAQISDGVDQIVGALDSGVQGLYQAAQASVSPVEVYQVFKLDCAAADNVVGAGIVNWAALIESAVTDYAAGDLDAGVTLYGVSNPEIQRFEFCPGKSTPEQEAKAEELRVALSDGSLVPAPGVGESDPGYVVDKK